jgi:hypothetical protein
MIRVDNRERWCYVWYNKSRREEICVGKDALGQEELISISESTACS